jgi:hypothetical protein
MTGELSWEDLVLELEKASAPGPLQATWLAYEGNEDYGIWLLQPFGPELEERRSSFSLFAAHAIRRLGIRPVAVPQPGEFCPHWKIVCPAEEKFGRQQGKSLDVSQLVPFGLGTIDGDAVDPCTRAWLELLRQENRAFRINRYGTETIKNNRYYTVFGIIDDVCAASAAYIKRRARDQIGSQLMESAGKQSEAKVQAELSPKEVLTAAKLSLGYLSWEQFAARIGIGRDTLYAIKGETKWVSDESYIRAAQACKCSPEDLHPRDIPLPSRRRR